MIHPHGYWLEISESNKHCCDHGLCDAIIKMFKVRTVADLGCGDGAYTFAFIRAGVDCKGYDGSPLTQELTSGLCDIIDLTEHIKIGRYDMVLSLEVGEHIPQEYEQIFIDNICNASKRWVCLSWGIPGQPGYGHVNCQTNQYIILEMQKRGFKYDKVKSNILRKNSSFEWFKNTMMVYELGK
jgi:hypothetical protein